ncbi:MAG: hypothetical protein OXF08_06060 [Bacteroidetes bacterium]|nr:hypothetical protein [Bacteroidota bacterium]
MIGSSGSIFLACTDTQEGEKDLQNIEENLSADQAFSCSDLSALTEAERSLRDTFEYTDESPIEGQNCTNCTLYVVPEIGESCGGCLTIKGPIHPHGYCTIWAAQTG